MTDSTPTAPALLRRIAPFVAALIAAGSATAEPEWIAFEADGIAVYARANDDARRDLERTLPRLRDALAFFTGVDPREANRSIELFLFGEGVSIPSPTTPNRAGAATTGPIAPLREAAFVHGETASGLRYRLDGRRGADRVPDDLAQALAHGMLRSAPGAAPRWLVAGFERFAARFEVVSGDLVVGRLRGAPAFRLLERVRYDVDRLVRPGRFPELAPDAERFERDLAGLLVHELAVQVAGPRIQTSGRSFREFRRLVDEGLSSADAMAIVWGQAPEALERRLDRAIHARRHQIRRFDLDALPSAGAPFAVRSLSAAETERRLGALHLALGEVDAAVDRFETAIAIAPRSGEAWADLALARLAADDLAGAEAAADRALALAPDAARAELARSRVEMRRGRDGSPDRYRNAAERLARATRLAPTDVDVAWAVATLALRSHPRGADETVAALERVLALDPGFTPAREALARARAVRGETRAARRHIDRLLAEAEDASELARARDALAALESEAPKHASYGQPSITPQVLPPASIPPLDCATPFEADVL